jgi:hypothetical protein
MIDNAQNCEHYINIQSLQTYRTYLTHLMAYTKICSLFLVTIFFFHIFSHLFDNNVFS